MLEFKIIVLLASIYLFLFECLCFNIQKDSVNTEHMVKEFLEKRHKSRSRNAWLLRLPKRDYVCRHSSRFLAFLCAEILKQDPYHEVIDPEKYKMTACDNTYISLREGIVRHTEADRIRLYSCPVKHSNEFNFHQSRYYLSKTHIKSSLFLYVSNDEGFHIFPDAFVNDIHMVAIRKKYAKSKMLKKMRRNRIDQYQLTLPLPRSATLQSLFDERMILIYSQNILQNARLFEYLNFRDQKLPYKKFEAQYNKINICSLRLQQQIYMCKQILDNAYYTFTTDLNYYRKNNCRKRKILYESWERVHQVSTIMCPPTYSNEKHGLEKRYNRQSYFLSSGPDTTSVIIFQRLYNERYIKPTILISSFKTGKLVKIVEIERSQPWSNPSTSESDTESQSSLSSGFSSDRQSTTSSIFSSSSPDRNSQSTFSGSSSPEPGLSEFSLNGLSSPDNSPPISVPTTLTRKSSILSFFGTPSLNKKLQSVAMDINHDRYVAEEETIQFSALKSVKNPYERFQLAHTTMNICNFKEKLRVQLCKEILQSPEFGYQLITNTENTSCQQQNIAVNLQDSEDLFSNKMSLLQCPDIEAFDSIYYLASSRQNRSVILFRKLGVLEFIYPEAFISYVDKDILEQKASPKVSPNSSPLKFFYSSPQS